jgi:hypothetical protein
VRLHLRFQWACFTSESIAQRVSLHSIQRVHVQWTSRRCRAQTHSRPTRTFVHLYTEAAKCLSIAHLILYTPAPLKQPVLGTGLCGVAAGALLLLVLGLAGHLEEQTGALTLLDRVAQVAAMGRVTVVLNVLAAGGVGQAEAVLLRDVAHDIANGLLVVARGRGQGRQDGRGDEGGLGGRCEGDELGRRLQRNGGVRVAAQDALDGRG